MASRTVLLNKCFALDHIANGICTCVSDCRQANRQAGCTDPSQPMFWISEHERIISVGPHSRIDQHQGNRFGVQLLVLGLAMAYMGLAVIRLATSVCECYRLSGKRDGFGDKGPHCTF
jgi:hypothetical protein